MRTLTRVLEGAPTLTIDVIALLHNSGLSTRDIRAYTPIVKQHSVSKEIGEKVVDAILKNTLGGNDRHGKPFVKYSEAYKKSLIFKIYKGGKRKPDLKLTGNMQADLAVINATDSTVTVGFTDAEESEKAKGHITGANYLPRRDFFGLKSEELKDIMLQTIKEYEANAIFDIDEIVREAAPRMQTEDYQDIRELLYGS